MSTTYPIAGQKFPKDNKTTAPYPVKKPSQGNKKTFLFSVESFDILINNSIRDKLTLTRWERIKGLFENTANYYVTGSDFAFVAQLCQKVTGKNSVFYIKSYAGVPHIVVSGSSALQLRLTNIGSNLPNPTVIKFAVGSESVMKSIKSGGIITVVLVTAYHVANYFLGDKQTLSKLYGSVASDIIKIGLSSAIAAGSTKLATLYLGSAVFLSAGPILGIIVVGVLVGQSLNYIDQEFSLTNKLTNAIDTHMDNIAKNEYEKLSLKIHSSVALGRLNGSNL
ncbi:TPA: hypothetical protein NKU94_003020 [Vibrio parahaemolyticus]|nr:hypothetical protein [Vibrio parahaemolyticus]